MYDIELKTSTVWMNSFSYTSKNDSGQIIHLLLSGERKQKHIFYFVMFQIGKRKDGFQYMKTTGKDGLKSLFWAKNCIKHFIEYLKNQSYTLETDKDIKHTVVVQWNDNRRRNTYYRGLKSLKFYYGMYDGGKCLMHDIK